MSDGSSRFPPPPPWEQRPAAEPDGWPPRPQDAHPEPPAAPAYGTPAPTSAPFPPPFTSGRPTTGQGSHTPQRGGWGWAPGRSVAESGQLQPLESWAAPAAPPPAHPAASAVNAHPPHAPDVSELQTRPGPALRKPAPSLADLPTERVAAHAPQRATAAARPRGSALRRWIMRLLVAATLVALGLRADVYSLAFMSPGGAIVGWTTPPQAQNPFTNVPPVTSSTHIWTPPEYAAYLTQHMSLDAELGQMIMIQFYQSAITPDLSNMIATYHVGGALLLGRPVQVADRGLNAELQQAAGNQLLVAIDQEGGYVNRFYDVAGPLPAAATLTTPDAAHAQGMHDAQLLHQYGYNMDLAPVVDVGAPNEDPQFFGRTFSDDPQQVAPLAGAYMDGLQSTGAITAVLKHFPGGVEATGQDPHMVLPFLARSQADWERIDLAPYRTLLANNDVRAIMVTHEMLPAVDPNLPTSLSPAVITGTLRTELGFDGVVISDDLHMEALARWGTIAQLSVMAVEAGTDIVADLATPDEVSSTVAALKGALASGQLTKVHIDASVQRILELKMRMGLIPLPKPANPRPRRPLPDDPTMAQGMMYPVRATGQAAAA